jgi:hypothetical protein
MESMLNTEFVASHGMTALLRRERELAGQPPGDVATTPLFLLSSAPGMQHAEETERSLPFRVCANIPELKDWADECGVPADATYSICWANITDEHRGIKVRACGQVYGADCMHNWIHRLGRMPTCPMCRRGLFGSPQPTSQPNED